MAENRNDRTAAERMRRYRARLAGKDIPRRRPGRPRRAPDLSPVTLEQLVWEVSYRLDELAEPVITEGIDGSFIRRVDPELEALLISNGGPVGGYSGAHSARDTPAIDILPASQVV